jgi:hypothetical protein
MIIIINFAEGVRAYIIGYPLVYYIVLITRAYMFIAPQIEAGRGKSRATGTWNPLIVRMHGSQKI